jgi:hypothetical protein
MIALTHPEPAAPAPEVQVVGDLTDAALDRLAEIIVDELLAAADAEDDQAKDP